MRTGGITNNDRSQRIIRVSGLVVSLVIAAYTLLVLHGFLPNFGYDFSHVTGYTIAGIWAAAGILEYIFFRMTPLNILIRITGYHILAAVYLLFITGFGTMPFSACWILLTIATYSYFSLKGVGFNLVILWLTAFVDGLARSAEPNVLATNLAVATSLTLVIMAIIYITRAQERDDVEFQASKQAEELQRESLLTLVNNIADAVLATDGDGVVRVFNAAALNLLDTNENLLDKPVDTLLTLKDANDKHVKLKALLKKSHSMTINDTLRTVIADEEIRLEITYSPISQSYAKKTAGIDDRGYIIIMRDVTKAKSLEEERDEFISVVSHELRTPIAITEGAIDNARLIFDKDGSDKKIISSSLDTAHEQVIFLSRMVNDLSTLSRAERGVADAREQIDVSELIQSMYKEYLPEAQAKELKFNLHATGKLGTVMASRLYLQELLQNFITNAIKYTKEGSIDLTVKVSADRVNFSVTDTGIGISKSDQIKIFRKFYRSEDYRTRETSGTGLGLYVSQKLARKLGCKIHVKSRLNHGSTFSFSLPVAEAADADAIQPPAA